MEILSVEFLTALLAIVAIDLVLAGDNAIVIALASRSLPPHLQKQAIIWTRARRKTAWAFSRRNPESGAAPAAHQSAKDVDGLLEPV